MNRAVVGALLAIVCTATTPSWALQVPVPTDLRLTQGFATPAPTGLEARLIADAQDGRLDDVTLVDAALIASGVPEADVAAEAKKLLAALAPARAQARLQTTAHKRGDRLLRALHASLFRQYVEGQSRVDRIVATNEFNCLSSAVVFAIAADGIVERPRGMLSTTHAFVRADVDGRAVDVETTTAAGFGVDRKKLVTREYLRQLGVGEGLSADALLKDLQSPDEVSVVGLIAALYSNRAVEAMRRGDIEGAAAAFDRSTRVASGALKTRVANWRGGLLNNAAASLLDGGRAAEARALLVVGLDAATGPTRNSLQANLATATITLATEARDARRYGEALAWVDEAIASGGVGANRASVMALRAELEGHLANGDASRCARIEITDDRARCLFVAAEAHLTAGQIEQALDVVRQASAATTTTETRGPVASLHHNVIVAALNAANTARDCARVEALVREIVAVDRSMGKAMVIDVARQSGGCSVEVGNSALAAGQLAAAAAAYARAATFLNNAPDLQHNRALVEIREAEQHARAGRCDDARPHVRRALDYGGADSTFAIHGPKLLASCASRRAASAIEAKRWRDAADELRRGLIDAPDDATLRNNLTAVLRNQLIRAVQAKRCDEARPLLADLPADNDDVIASFHRVCG